MQTEFRAKAYDVNMQEKRDLKMFLEYMKLICSVTGKTTNKVLVEASISRQYVFDIREHLKGNKHRLFKKKIYLPLLIRLYDAHKVPFNMSDYLHILEDNK